MLVSGLLRSFRGGMSCLKQRGPRKGDQMFMELRVVIAGAAGNMGSEAVRAVSEADDMQLIAAVDPGCVDEDAGERAGIGNIGLPIVGALDAVFETARPTVLVDFTRPDTVRQNVITAVEHGMYAVIGTTGLSESDWNEIDRLARKQDVGVLHAPNFAIGAVLMMRFAREAARFFPQAEIIELHHDRKRDAPSGTALHTAEMVRSVWKEAPISKVDEIEVVPGARGGNANGVPIHSVRLPGHVAHQEVMLGLAGETLTIRHDSIDRRCFMPGVLAALRNVGKLRGVHMGLESVLFSSDK